MIMKEFIKYVIEYPYIEFFKTAIYDYFHPIESWKKKKRIIDVTRERIEDNKND